LFIAALTSAAAGELSALFGSGANFLRCTRASAGGTAWTDSDTTMRVLVALIVDDATGYQARKINGGLVVR
jgi:hypothetical protein